jgi:hypothetical protein
MAPGYQQRWAETVYDTRPDFDTFAGGLEPDERIGTPLPGRRKSGFRTLFLVAVLGGGAWAAVATGLVPANFAQETAMPAVRSAYDFILAKAREIAARHEDAAPPPAAATDAVAPPSLAALVAQPQTSGEIPPLMTVAPIEEPASAPAVTSEPEPVSTESLGEAYAEKAEPAEEPGDKSPKRKEAIAVGLSPDLPNVLLSRLSKADFKNADYAVKTALAKTADDDRFSWPLKPSGQQALFEVRFVPGAAEGCRRYIVTVTKDRWTSTSAALEKCGVAHASAG